MSQWINSILTSEYLWGVLTGVALTFVGSILQARQIRSTHIDLQREAISSLTQDLIRNIMSVCDEIAEARRRSRAIHHDLIGLLDAEIAIFGRNREHTIRLPEADKSKVRKYFTEINLRRSDVVTNLAVFNQQMDFAKQLRANGKDNEANSIESDAGSGPLARANRAADELFEASRRGTELISILQHQK